MGKIFEKGDRVKLMNGQIGTVMKVGLINRGVTPYSRGYMVKIKQGEMYLVDSYQVLRKVENS